MFYLIVYSLFPRNRSCNTVVFIFIINLQLFRYTFIYSYTQQTSDLIGFFLSYMQWIRGTYISFLYEWVGW